LDSGTDSFFRCCCLICCGNGLGFRRPGLGPHWLSLFIGGPGMSGSTEQPVVNTGGGALGKRIGKGSH